MPRAMEHQTALLLRCLGRDEPHVCPSYRFADCLGIGRIVLLPLHVGLYIGRRRVKAAKAIGLTILDSFIWRADEVIE